MKTSQYLLLLFVAATCAFAGAGVMTWVLAPDTAQAQSSSVIEAKQLRIVDSRGRLRVQMGVWPQSERATFLGMNDANGKRRLTVGVTERGSPYAVFWDRHAKTFGVSPAQPSLLFYDRNGALVADLPRQTGSRKSLPRLGYASGGAGGKADSARPQDVRLLQQQIDIVRSTVNKLVDRVNTLSQ